MPVGGIFSGIAEGLHRRYAREESDRQETLRLLLSLATADPDIEPSLRAVIQGQTGRELPALPHMDVLRQRRAAERAAAEEERLFQRRRAESQESRAAAAEGRAAAGEAREVERFALGKKDIERQQVAAQIDYLTKRRQPIPADLQAKARELGVPIQVRREVTTEERPAVPVTGTGRGLEQAGLPQIVKTGEAEYEVPEYQAPQQLHLIDKRTGMVRVVNLPHGAKHEIVESKTEEPDVLITVYPNGRTTQQPLPRGMGARIVQLSHAPVGAGGGMTQAQILVMRRFAINQALDEASKIEENAGLGGAAVPWKTPVEKQQWVNQRVTELFNAQLGVLPSPGPAAPTPGAPGGQVPPTDEQLALAAQQSVAAGHTWTVVQRVVPAADQARAMQAYGRAVIEVVKANVAAKTKDPRAQRTLLIREVSRRGVPIANATRIVDEAYPAGAAAGRGTVFQTR